MTDVLKATTRLQVGSEIVRVGDLRYADDPLVEAHPDCFEPAAPKPPRKKARKASEEGGEPSTSSR